MKKILIITLIVSAILCGCKSTELVAYRTLGAVAQSVDVAKHVYYDLRATGHVTQEQDVLAKATYIKYQAAMKVAQDAELTFKTSVNKDETVWATAYSAVSASARDFVNLINIIKGKKI